MSENINPEESQSVTESVEVVGMTPTTDDLGTTEATEPSVGMMTTDEPTEDEPETFPRSYVEKLRKEAAGHRDRAKRADDLAQRLHTTLVEATGRLADARDLPFDESHLDDPAALSEAIDALLADKPHLATRKPMGNIGQGVTPVGNDVSLAGILRAGAM
ncbi:hypothetical protein [Corynebacterium casei]|uniref:hypothetical protein n=1 Tax=Actinomycetes TaxID=1760 RepID=UPI003F985D0D